MKFLAILKDSLREALDSKLLYFTLGVSILVIGLVASVTFRSVPAEEQAGRMAQFMSWAAGMVPGGSAPSYRITDFEQTNKASEPWEGEYRFTYVQEFGDEGSLKRAKDNGFFQSVGQVEREFKDAFHWAEKVSATDLGGDNPLVIRYRVQTEGSTVHDRQEWTHEPALFFGLVPIPIFQAPLAALVDVIADKIIGTYGAGIMMLLSIIITASFIPTMMRKGTVDLLLAKPIHRPSLLVYKFIGGLVFMFINTVVIMVGIWLGLGLQTHMWLMGLLLCIFLYTFEFAIFYAVSTLLAVLTRSPIIAILLCVVMWGVLFAVGWGYRYVDARRPDKLKDNPLDQANRLAGWVYPTADAIHFVLPHYKDLDALTTKLIYHDMLEPDSRRRREIDESLRGISWTESLGMSTVFIALMVGLSCWRFTVKDY